MRKLLLLAIFLLIGVNASAQTNLKLTVTWSGGATVQLGTVTLQHQVNTSPVTWSVDESNVPLINGSISLSGFVIQPNTMYQVLVSVTTPATVTPPNTGYLLTLPFMVPGIVIDPAKIVSAEVHFAVVASTGQVAPGSTRFTVVI